MDEIKDFLDSIERYLKAADLTPTEFGRAAVNSPSFVFNLRSGTSPTMRTVTRVRQYMSANPKHEVAE